MMEKRSTLVLLVLCTLVLMAYITSGDLSDFPSLANNTELSEKISDYHIFDGPIAALKPAADFKEYQLTATLFTDYAEKQRLVKVPKGVKLTAVTNGLPDFPDGTILVKTFYYYHDKRDTSKGKQVIESRVMIKSDSRWSAGTYQWNKEQTEAFLVTRGLNTPVSWLDKDGNSQSISYHIPKTSECATCHNADNKFMPIGPKIRNLNRDIMSSKGPVNQLTYLREAGILNKTDPASFQKLSNWEDKSLPVEDRARAYLDINCAHCHSEQGYCSGSRLKLGYDLAFEHTRIAHQAGRIDRFMSKKTMPMLGTTIVDKEGLELIREYINTFKVKR